jgi:hypothetical protein
MIFEFKASKIYLESTPNAILNPRVTEIFGSIEDGSNIFLISPIMWWSFWSEIFSKYELQNVLRAFDASS